MYLGQGGTIGLDKCRLPHNIEHVHRQFKTIEIEISPLPHMADCEKVYSLMGYFYIFTFASEAVCLSGRVVRTLDLRSTGCGFESWPLRCRVQPWASC